MQRTVLVNGSSNFNLSLMNLLIGMCKGASGLPRDLWDLGYVDKWIELGFPNSEGRTVVPELIIASRKLRHCVLFEWKSGNNTETDQLNRYSKITEDDLRQRAFLTAAESERHDVAIIGADEHRERIAIAIDREGHPFPLLIAVSGGIEIVRNVFKEDQLDKVFRPRLSVQWENIPTSFLPVDRDSKLHEFAEVIIPEVLQNMARNESRVLLDPLTHRIFPLWDYVGAKYQSELRSKVREVMSRAVAAEFQNYVRRNKSAEQKTHTPTWDITLNPFTGSGRSKRTELRRMKVLQSSFIQSLRSEEAGPYQEKLFK